MLLPKWFPFHLMKVSYWSRTVLVPILVLMAMKPRAQNPRGLVIEELFLTPPDEVQKYLRNPTGSRWGEIFLGLDRMLRLAEPSLPLRSRARAIDRTSVG